METIFKGIAIYVLLLMALFVAAYFLALLFAENDKSETFEQRYNWIKILVKYADNKRSFESLLEMVEEASNMPDANKEQCQVLDAEIRAKVLSL